MDILETLRISLWLLGIATVITTLVIGIILGYHWRKYSGSAPLARFSIFTYFIVGLFLELLLLGSIPA